MSVYLENLIKALSEADYEQNREKYLEYNREYYKKNRDKILARRRELRKERKLRRERIEKGENPNGN